MVPCSIFRCWISLLKYICDAQETIKDAGVFAKRKMKKGKVSPRCHNLLCHSRHNCLILFLNAILASASPPPPSAKSKTKKILSWYRSYGCCGLLRLISRSLVRLRSPSQRAVASRGSRALSARSSSLLPLAPLPPASLLCSLFLLPRLSSALRGTSRARHSLLRSLSAAQYRTAQELNAGSIPGFTGA
eukprot:2783097-Rhodomonas_salina.2